MLVTGVDQMSVDLALAKGFMASMRSFALLRMTGEGLGSGVILSVAKDLSKPEDLKFSVHY